MADNDENSLKIKGIVECSICLETLTKPKCLPCVHTYCLHCLEGYWKGKLPGEKVECPMCRHAFLVPQGGFERLPSNFLIEQLLETVNATECIATVESRADCEVCDKDDADKFCVECGRNLCESCANVHKRSHTIITKAEKKIYPILVSCENYCNEHIDVKLDMYCNDCGTAICLKCFHYEHKSHVTSCKTKVSDKFKADITKSGENLNAFAEMNKRELKELSVVAEEYLEQFSNIEREIRGKGNEVKQLVDSQVQKLLDQLECLKNEKMNVIRMRKEEVESQLFISQSYKQYVDVMIEKGRSGNVTRSSMALLKRAEEIVASQNACEIDKQTSKLGFQKVSFQKVALQGMRSGSSNFIGTISSEDNYINTLALFGPDDSLNVMQEICHIHLSCRDTVNTIDEVPTRIQWGTAACTFAEYLYLIGVGLMQNELWRYSSHAEWIRLADLPESGRRSHCVAVVGSMLYVLGGFNASDVLSTVLMYDISTNSWSTAGCLTHAVKTATCLTYKESIYVFGGRNVDNQAVAHVQVYNTMSQTCTLLHNALPGARTHMRAVLWETSAVLLGCDTCFIYNFESQTWLERKQFKTDVLFFGLVLNNDTLFVAGGGTSEVDKDNKTAWTCSDEIRCTSLLDIMQDKPAVWRHHAKLPRPALVHAYNTIPLRLRW